MTRIGLAAATAAGRRLAADLAGHLDGHVHAGSAREAIAAAWRQADQLILVMATGAAVRLLAQHLSDKGSDPGVVCVDDAGRFAIALAGGHERGANALAERVAVHLGATPVITTASEALDTPSLSGLGSAFGMRVDPGSDLAAVGGALVSGRRVHLLRERNWPLGPVPDVVEVDEPVPPLLWVTERVVEPPRPAVIYRPPTLVVGVGASRGVAAQEVGGLVDRALADAGLSPWSVACLATVDLKGDEEGIVATAAARGWPLRTLSVEQLAGVAVPNPSAVVAAAVGTPSVAEAAALHLGGELLVEKRRGSMATVAIARRPPQGHLALVSLGPGAPDLVPPRARAALARAEIVVGYRRYVELARPHLARGTRVETFPLGDEVARAHRALELTRSGHAVAVVSSGDVGVYAMASPTLERADAHIEVEVIPGVTAALAAAALLGSPLGHDHCAISLSDLLTPWEVVRRRVAAAAHGDFVVAFYNPRSSDRVWQLDEARRILLGHRQPGTPAGVVHNAFRPGQRVHVTTLAELDVEDVDMTTVVLVGNSQTRLVAGRMVTPRGYM
ncbi:MAG: precorrin-3B C(17)-methyltransferase [Actinomycetota bacterium]|nr:precorrin-3B C(17)-methyltransferase [Actinomycetota bacterium]